MADVGSAVASGVGKYLEDHPEVVAQLVAQVMPHLVDALQSTIIALLQKHSAAQKAQG